MTYAEKLRDPRWQKKRLQILERDEFKCRDCGDETNTLHVHHCHYIGSDPWHTPNALLLTVCGDCHTRRQELEADCKTALAYLLAKMSNEPDGSELQTFTEQAVHASQEPDFSPVIVNEGELLDLELKIHQFQRGAL